MHTHLDRFLACLEPILCPLQPLPLGPAYIRLITCESTITAHLLTSLPIYDPEPFRLNWMLPTPQLSIATLWPNHPSMSAFVFYYTLSQRSILSTNLTDSMAYKYNNKDTKAIPVTHGSRSAIKTGTFAWLWLWWHLLRHHSCSFRLTAQFLHWFCFFTTLIRLHFEGLSLFG